MTHIRNITEATKPARKPHRCEECGRTIPKGMAYLRQTNTDGGDIWTYKAHLDCRDLGDVVRSECHMWCDDWMPLREIAQDTGYIEQHRGRFPHAVCRIEFTNRNFAGDA
jgi:hypothetical protein